MHGKNHKRTMLFGIIESAKNIDNLCQSLQYMDDYNEIN